MKRVGRRLPGNVREQIRRRLRGRLGSSLDRLLGRPPSTPPLLASPKAITTGGKLVRQMAELCHLTGSERVLEIGCGGGGPALALTAYLSSGGTYDGMDIEPRRIERARQLISAEHPNFRFHVADIYNASYNPTGACRASDYRFPFPDHTFDLIFLASVFTHMLPPDVEHYLGEVARLLRPGGRCLITYFLLNPESERLIASGRSGKTFRYDLGSYRAESEVHERAIAFPEALVRDLYARVGLQIQEPVHYGRWSGRERFLSKQDVIVAVRT